MDFHQEKVKSVDHSNICMYVCFMRCSCTKENTLILGHLLLKVALRQLGGFHMISYQSHLFYLLQHVTLVLPRKVPD